MLSAARTTWVPFSEKPSFIQIPVSIPTIRMVVNNPNEKRFDFKFIIAPFVELFYPLSVACPINYH